MNPTLYIPPLGRLAQAADRCMMPIMRHPWVSFPHESPMLTHVWNNARVPASALSHLNRSLMVSRGGDPDAPRRSSRFDLRFHLGHWPRYVVVQPKDYVGRWYIGWISETHTGYSRIPVSRKARALRGPDATLWFGIAKETNEQIHLEAVGEGRLGFESPFRNVPLY